MRNLGQQQAKLFNTEAVLDSYEAIYSQILYEKAIN